MSGRLAVPTARTPRRPCTRDSAEEHSGISATNTRRPRTQHEFLLPHQSCRRRIGAKAGARAVEFGVPSIPRSLLSVAGAGLVVVDVSLAVVVPAEELQVLEVGGSAACPVPDVMWLAVARGAVTAGGLAVSVAHHECFPLRRGGSAVGAADVEDLGAAGDDHPAERAVAQQQFDRRLPTGGRCSGVRPAVR